MRIAVYPGSFDPITYGHLDVVRRATEVFDRLVVAVLVNTRKAPASSADERVRVIRDTVREAGLDQQDRVIVTTFEGLTVDFVVRSSASVMLRGLRTVSDQESEFSMALANSTLAPQIETVFLMAGEKFSHISSTLIRQIALFGQGTAALKLRQFVPEPVIAPLLARCHDRQQSGGV